MQIQNVEPAIIMLLFLMCHITWQIDLRNKTALLSNNNHQKAKASTKEEVKRMTPTDLF